MRALVTLALFLVPTAPSNQARSAETRFLRGDVDLSGDLGLTDPLLTLRFLFASSGALPCAAAADADDDGSLGVGDAVRLLQVLFLGGTTLPWPFPACGKDPTADNLTCEGAGSCRGDDELDPAAGAGGSLPDDCALEDALFHSGEGGCKQTSSSLVWVNLSQEGWQWDWTSAVTLAQDLTTGGYTDWRLPTVAELQSLAAQNPFHLKILAGDYGYWAAETKGKNAWGVLIGGAQNGTAKLAPKAAYRFVLCVRPGTP